MKTLKTARLPGLLIFLIFTFMTGCVMTVTETGTYRSRHRHRHVWVGDIYYKQVYYIDVNTHQEVIYTQTEVKRRHAPKDNHDNGNHGGNRKNKRHGHD